MSKTVDSRVVEMRFDNQQFESNVKTSISTLEKLKASLNMSSASKSFKELETASESVSFDALASGVEALQNRFSTLGIVGMRVVENLTDSMMGLASKAVSFLTDGVVQGGITRAMNLENAHFQLQGLLKDEEAVSAVMQNVNDAVDGTAYSLDAAAKVASQFAASGMTAGDEMYTSLRAIAGVAAMTNSEYSDIGDIFTTISGQGKVMTYQLNQLASRGLNAAATLADYLGITEAEVREMVTAGKIDFQTFADAMDDAFGEHAKKANETFTGAISNIKAALARIGAEFISPLVEQNGALVQMFNTLRLRINDIKNNIGPLADMFVSAVETMANGVTEYFGQLDLTKHFEAFYNFVESIKNVFKGVWSVIKPILEAFSETFLTNAVDGVVSFSESLKTLTEKFKMSDTDAENLKSTFEGLFSILNAGLQVVKSVAKVFGSMIEALSPIGSVILSVTGKIGGFLGEIADAITSSETLCSVTSKLSELIKSGLGTAFEAFSLVLKRFAQRARDAGDTLSAIKDILVNNGITSALSNLCNRIIEVAGKAIQMIGNLGKAIIEQLANINFSEIFDVLSGVSLAAITTAIVKFFSKLKDSFNGFSSIKEMFQTFGKDVKRVLDSLKSSLEAWQNDLKAVTLQKIAVAVAVLAAAIVALSFIDSDKLAASLGAIGVLFGELLAATEIFSKIATFEKGSAKAATVMIGMAAAVNILASAMKKIGSLDWEQLGVGLSGMTVAIGELVAAMRIMNAAKSTSSVKDALTLLAMAESVKILGNALVGIAALSWGQLGKGCAGITVAIGELTAAMRIVNASNGTSSTKDALTLLAMAESVKILGNTLIGIAALNWTQLASGCIVMTVAIGEIVAAMRIMNSAKGTSSVKDAIVLIAAAEAVNLLGKAITNLASLNWEQLGKGCVGMTIAIGDLVAAISILNAFAGTSSLKNAVGMIAAAESMVILAGAIQTFGNMSVEQIARGLITLAGALTAMVAALNFAQGTLSGAAALLVMAAALRVLTPVLETLGNMSVGQIAASLITLAGALAILIAAAYMAGPVAPIMLAITGAVALLGVGLAAAGVGVLAFATGLAALGTAFAVNGAAIRYAIESLLDIIPTFFEKIGEGIVALVTAIADSADAIVDAIINIVSAVVDAIVKCAPTIAQGAMELIIQVLSTLTSYAPQIMESLFQFIFTILQGVINYTPQYVSLLMELFTGILNGVAANLSELISAAVNVAAAFFSGVGEALGEVVGSIVGGFLEGMSSSLPEIGNNLSEFAENLGPFFSIANSINPSAMEGVKSLAEAILILTANDLLSGIKSFFGFGKSSLSDFADELNIFAQNIIPFADAIQALPESFGNNCRNLTEGLMPIIEMAKNIPNEGGLVSKITGDNSLAVFASELSSAGSDISAFADTIQTIGNEFVTNCNAFADGLTAIVEMAKNIPNEGGLVSKITGDNSIVSFANELVSAGENVATFSSSINELGGDFAVRCGVFADGLTALIEIANKMGNQTDGKTIKTFTESLSDSAEPLKNFASAIGDINDLGSVRDNLQIFADFALSLNNVNTDSITSFGKALKTFSDDISSVEPEQVIEFGEALKTLNDNLESCGFLNGASANLTSMSCDLLALINIAKELQGIDFNSIVSFGEALMSLSNSLAEVNFTDASSFATQLKAIAETGIDGFVSAFTNAEANIKSAGENLVNNLKTGIESKIMEIKSAGETLSTNFKTGIESKTREINAAGINIAESALSGISSKNSEYSTVGANAIQGFISGMNSQRLNVEQTAASIAQAALTSAKAALDVNSPSKEFMKLGMSTDEGMVLGIQNGEDDVSNAASSMAQGTIDAVEDTLDINSPSVVMNEEGHYIVQGIAEGIEEDMTAEEAAEQKAQNILDAFQTVFDKWELRISVAENEESLWLDTEGRYSSEGAKTERYIDTLNKKIESQTENVKAAQDQYDIMIENFGESSEKAVEAYNTLLEEQDELQEFINEITEQNYEYSKSWIEKMQTYSLLDDQALVDAWGRMLDKYADVTENRDEIYEELLSLDLGDYESTQYLITKLEDYLSTLDENSEAYSMMGQIIATQKSNYLTSRYENSENWISKMENYGIYGTVDKLAAAYRELKYFTEAGVTSGEDWKSLNETIYDLTKEIYDASIEYEAELKEKQEERAEERLELEKEWADEAEAINDQLKEDINELESEYNDALASRTDALYDAYGLFDEVDELEEVDPETLYTNLQDQIDRMDEWQDTLDELSARGLNDSLIEELQDMGVSSYAQVKALNTMTDSQLQQYADLWAEKHEQATDRATAELEDYRDDIDEQITDLTDQADEDLEALNKKYEKALEEFDKATEDALAEITQTFQEEIGIIKTDVPTQFAEMTEKSIQYLNEGGWTEAGQAIVGGLAEGVDSQYGMFVDSIISLGEGGIAALKQVLGIASPSKEFAKLGVFVDEGLISGLESQEYRVTDEITQIGESMINALSNVTDVDCEPTIRPVVDLSDMDYGLNQMNGAFSMGRSVELTYSLSNQNGLISQLDDLISGFTSSNAESNDKIADAIEGLKNDFADLLDKVGQLQVVMDTGTLVGAITPQMNRSLGTVAVMNRRGI